VVAGNRNVVIELLDAAQARLDHPFLIEPTRTWTYGDVLDRTRSFAAALIDAGAKPGDRVVVQVEKSPDAVALYLACLWAGTVHVPLNPAFTTEERAYFVDDAEPVVVVVDPAATTDPTWLTLGTDGDGTLAQRADAAAPADEAVDRHDDDLAALLYTSGTTGRPKGAALTHDGLRRNARALHDAWQFTPDDHLIHALPLFHVHGLFVALHCALLSAIPMTFLRRFAPDAVIDALATGTVLMGVPTHYARLCNSPRLSADACSTMRLFTCGSAPLTEPAFAEFAHRSGHTICERYGMSETGITISNPYDGERLAGTVGFPLPGVDAKVIGEDERELPRGEIGVLAIRSQQVMREYWRRPEATAAAHTNDGWFITGDVASMAPDGRVTLQGRAGDMIISGGENIYPKEIELVLDAIDGITESAVIGVPDDDFGERVLAVLVCDDTPLDETELRPHLDRSLARFKHPRRFEVVEALPRNAMGKVQKSVLRQRYAAGD